MRLFEFNNNLSVTLPTRIIANGGKQNSVFEKKKRYGVVLTSENVDIYRELKNKREPFGPINDP